MRTFGLILVDLDALRERIPREQGGAGQHPGLPGHLVLLHCDLDRVHGWHERHQLCRGRHPRAPHRAAAKSGRGARNRTKQRGRPRCVPPHSTSFHSPSVPWRQVLMPPLHPRPIFAFLTRSGKPQPVPFAQRS